MTREEEKCYLESGIATLQGSRKKSDIRIDDILEVERGRLHQVIRIDHTDDIYEPTHVRLFDLEWSDRDRERGYSSILMERSYYPKVYNETHKLVYRK